MNITVIGAGNMGGALIHGWAKSGKLSSLTISDKNEALLDSFKSSYPTINTTTDNVAAVKGADIVAVVVKVDNVFLFEIFAVQHSFFIT